MTTPTYELRDQYPRCNWCPERSVHRVKTIHPDGTEGTNGRICASEQCASKAAKHNRDSHDFATTFAQYNDDDHARQQHIDRNLREFRRGHRHDHCE